MVRRIKQSIYTRTTISKIWNFKTRRSTVLKNIKLPDPLIVRLYNYERASRAMDSNGCQ